MRQKHSHQHINGYSRTKISFFFLASLGLLLGCKESNESDGRLDGDIGDAPRATLDTPSSDTACPNPKPADYCYGGVPGGNCSDIVQNPVCEEGKLVCPAGSIPMGECGSIGGVVSHYDGGIGDAHIVQNADSWSNSPVDAAFLDTVTRPLDSNPHPVPDSAPSDLPSLTDSDAPPDINTQDGRSAVTVGCSANPAGTRYFCEDFESGLDNWIVSGSDWNTTNAIGCRSIRPRKSG